MPIIPTKYEDTVNNNVKFDVSKFDYAYIDVSTDEETDFADIIDNEAGADFDMIRETTTYDGMGNAIDVSNVTTTITAYIMDISKKDRVVHKMGLAVSGNRILYVKPSYDSGAYSVQEDDILLDRNNYRWRVVKIIHEKFENNNEVYKKAVIKSIGLQGSP